MWRIQRPNSEENRINKACYCWVWKHAHVMYISLEGPAVFKMHRIFSDVFQLKGWIEITAGSLAGDLGLNLNVAGSSPLIWTCFFCTLPPPLLSLFLFLFYTPSLSRVTSWWCRAQGQTAGRTESTHNAVEWIGKYRTQLIQRKRINLFSEQWH